MLLPYKTKSPPESFPFACLTLILLNVVIYFATTHYGLVVTPYALEHYGLSGKNASFLTYTTSMFLHAEPMHLLGNMWFLYLFGWAVEGRIKAPRFLLGYFAAGYFGSFLHQLVFGMSHPEIPSLGASGAIMGVMGMALRMFPHAQMEVFWIFWYRWGTTIWKLMWLAIMYVAIDLFEGLLGIAAGASGGTANFAHLGGAAMGFALAFIFCPKSDSEEISEAKAYVSESKDFLALEPHQMAEMMKHQPDDALLAHTWLWQSLRSNKVSPESIAAFKRLLPAMFHDPLPLADTLCMLSMQQPKEAPIPMMLRLADQLEKEGQPAQAMNVLNAVSRNPAASDSQHRDSILLLGKIQEQWFRQYETAYHLYTQFLQRWPMDPLSGVVQERLRAVTGRPNEAVQAGPRPQSGYPHA